MRANLRCWNDSGAWAHRPDAGPRPPESTYSPKSNGFEVERLEPEPLGWESGAIRMKPLGKESKPPPRLHGSFPATSRGVAQRVFERLPRFGDFPGAGVTDLRLRDARAAGNVRSSSIACAAVNSGTSCASRLCPATKAARPLRRKRAPQCEARRGHSRPRRVTRSTLPKSAPRTYSRRTAPRRRDRKARSQPGNVFPLPPPAGAARGNRPASRSPPL